MALPTLAMGFASCTDTDNPYPDVSHYVRLLTKTNVMMASEELTVKAQLDTLAGSTYTLDWTILDPTVAEIDHAAGDSVVIKGLQAGTTVIQVQARGTNLMYFSDLNVTKYYPFFPILVDFGTTASPAPWNNYLRADDPEVQDLTDVRGKHTGFGIVTSSAWGNADPTDAGNHGVIDRVGAISNTLGFPNEASGDMFWCDAVAGPCKQGSVRLTNLDMSTTYNFYLYSAINDSNTQNTWTVNGANSGTADLVTAGNTGNYSLISGITPKSDGTIDIVVSPGPLCTQWAGFISINAMVVTCDDYKVTFPISY
jgi:hypothetical protein